MAIEIGLDQCLKNLYRELVNLEIDLLMSPIDDQFGDDVQRLSKNLREANEKIAKVIRAKPCDASRSPLYPGMTSSQTIAAIPMTDLSVAELYETSSRILSELSRRGEPMVIYTAPRSR